ncbi:sensor histidine kinase [Paraglaciecola arctica]|uniref:histidine kinase n=1 Tax=Paraglaciecola arctica BSs20135 TaxID=493475 RepID=K6YTA9_9ALTE|nr:ATP-binding protein [Paraglaciecola arctica]GAC21387.1 two-component system, OmpR family, sensor kinase [Paraglaciecola arctica BSs20135]
MRLLTLSLIVAVLAATIGLGRMLDSLFYYVVPSSSSLHNDNVLILEQIGQELADTLNTMERPQDVVTNWPKHGRYHLSIVPLDQIQLPTSLMQQVKSGEPLLLTNNNEFSLYFYLETQQALLLLKPTFSTSQPETGELKLMLTLLFYAALVLLIWMWTYPLVSRLINLRHSAQLFGKGQLDQRIKVGSVSYVKDLENEFNHMAQRIQNLVSDVKLLSNAVSHDLRTPLARMRFGIDTIAEEQNPDQQHLYLQRLGDDVDEMTCLVEILLDYARLEQTMVRIDKQKVDLNLIVQHCVKAKNATVQRIIFQPSTETSWVFGDPKYLQIVINNLLQNALQYGQSQVLVQVHHSEHQICLSIADDGTGFSEDEKDLLKPFVRGKHATDKTKGYGMGLAIVQRIIEWHDGELVITRSQKLKGAEIIIKLPI